MQMHIRHETRYRYERPVKYSVQSLHLTPRRDLSQRALSWTITAPGGQQMMLQMAYFDRVGQPVMMEFGPVLDLEDVLGGKVCALASRAVPRFWVMTTPEIQVDRSVYRWLH